ncbi:MAG: DNA adenine methylase [Hyphomicrobiales bacterium]
MESSPVALLKPVAPAKPVAPYVGGKFYLARRLVARIEAIPHDTYAEPFFGMGGVFLRRRQATKAEIINDINKEIITLYRILQRHYAAFLEMMRFQITSRAEFERLAKTDPSTLTDLERAARILYLQRTAYGGKAYGQTFGISPTNPGRFNVTKLGPILEDLHERLAGVVIECLPYGDFIRRYDKPETLFYLDPPYWGCENLYGPVFERADFTRLADQLAGIEGKFILSLNDTPEIRELFAAFRIDTVETTYSVQRKGRGKPAKEVVISNRP